MIAIKKYSIPIQFLTIAVLVFFSVIENNYSILITYTFFLLITFILGGFLKSSEIKEYFNCYIVGAIILIGLFYLDHGTYWNGPDDQMFYETAIGNDVDHVNMSKIKWWGYYAILSNYFKFIKVVIDFSQHFFHGLTLIAFLSSFIPYFYSRFLKDKVSDKSINTLIIILLILPQFLIYQSTYLRDSVISLLFVMLLFYSDKLKKWNFNKILIILIILLIAFSFRPASSYFLILYLVLQSIKKKKGMVFVLISFLIVGFYFTEKAFVEVNEVSETYRNLTISESSGSLGQSILDNNNLLFFPIKLLYIIFSPIPPELFYKDNLKAILFTLGSLIKYFYTIIFLIASIMDLRNRKKYNVDLTALIYVIVVTTLILSTSRDPRHLNFLLPLVFLKALVYIESDKLIRKRIVLYGVFVVPVVVLGYVLIKFG